MSADTLSATSTPVLETSSCVSSARTPRMAISYPSLSGVIRASLRSASTSDGSKVAIVGGLSSSRDELSMSLAISCPGIGIGRVTGPPHNVSLAGASASSSGTLGSRVATAPSASFVGSQTRKVQCTPRIQPIQPIEHGLLPPARIHWPTLAAARSANRVEERRIDRGTELGLPDLQIMALDVVDETFE